MTPTLDPTVLIVPGLRDHVEQHWQTILASELLCVAAVPPMGRGALDCAERVEAIERASQRVQGPLVIVAHSAGTIMVAHWAARTRRKILGALLATPPDFERPMPQGYPTLEQLAQHGCLPVPRAPLPFASIVAASRDDPLASFDRVSELAYSWNSTLVDLGAVGHLNPASGYGRWDRAHALIAQLVQSASTAA